MATNYPLSVAPREEIEFEAHSPDGFGERVFDRLRQAICGLHGHDTLLQFEQERMFLRCTSCGHETPGWELNETPPIATAFGEARPRVMARAPLVSARRIA
jgi:hypothetical protein